MYAIVSGIGEIGQGANHPPQYFTEDVLESLLKMRRNFRGQGGASSISVSTNGSKPVAVTLEVGDKAGKILNAGYWSFGSLEGRLEAVNFHGRSSFTIWDRVSRGPVRCFTPNSRDWRERVKSLLEKRVLVRGKIHYFHNGVPSSIRDIQDISDNTPDPSLPRAEFGSVPDEEAAKDPAKFLLAIRGY